MAHLRPALVLLLLFTVITGLAYPLAVTGIAAALLPSQAGGSLVARNGVVVGSDLIGQNFEDGRYFHGRPSATSAPDPADADKTIDMPYNAANSGGANLGPTSQKLMDRLQADRQTWQALTGSATSPGDALTTSASGLDPHISPRTALAQVAAVARARATPVETIRALVYRSVETPLFGVLGEPRVNVLHLNLALDALKPS